MTQRFDAAAELTSIQAQRKTMRKISYRKSRLLKFQMEIVALKKSGASLHDIALWLRQKKRIKVSHTTVMRFLAKLSEERENKNAQL